MKIGDHNSIRISGRSAAVAFLNKLAPGSEVQVRVQERLGPRTAVLNIKGQKVKAEFLQGVPGNNRLIMRLEGSDNNVFLFKIISSTSRHDFLDRILEFSVLQRADVLRENVADIGHLLGNRGDALFALHAYLLNMNAWKEERGSYKKLYDFFVSRGLSKGFLNQLFLMIAQGRGGTAFHFVYSLMLHLDAKRKGPFDQKVYDDEIEKMLSIIDNDAETENGDIIHLLLNALGTKNNEGGTFCFIPFDEDDESRNAIALLTRNCVIAHMEFSSLGCVDVLARKGNDVITIILVPELEKTRIIIENSLDELKKILYDSGLNVQVSVFQNNVVFDKIVEINSYFTLNSVFDVKV